MLRKDKTKPERISFKITNHQQLKLSLAEKDLRDSRDHAWQILCSHKKQIIVFG